MARAMLKAESCPSCGVDSRDFMDWSVEKRKCSVCKDEYTKVVPWNPAMMEGLRTVKVKKESEEP